MLGLVGVIVERAKQHGAMALVWRWLTGMPWHGKPHTNATWSRPGDKAVTEFGYARRFWYRPRRYRAACRSVSTLTVLLAVWGLLVAFWVTVGVLGAAAL